MLLLLATVVLIQSCFWFIISIFARRNDIADIAWGLGFIISALIFSINYPIQPIGKLVFILIIIWGLRLSIHLGIRNTGKEEDFRYKKWRQDWGKNFYWRSFLQVYLLQGFFMYLIALPIIVAAADVYSLKPSTGVVTLPTLAGFSLWLFGFLFQAVGDYQLTRFVKTKKTGQIMQTGLWRYSRHPNYFGEILMWWGIWLIVVSLPYGFWAIISPLTVTYLLAFVSGVPMLESKYKGNPAFEAYKQRTPALIPWFPKKPGTNSPPLP